MSEFKYISVEGNIGSGIDTVYPLLKQCKDKIRNNLPDFPMKIKITEDTDEYLTSSVLKDPNKNAFPFLIRSFLNRYNNDNDNGSGNNDISKRSFLSDMCRLETFLELNYISTNEYNICKDLYHTMEDKFPNFEETMFIYLKSNENSCYERLIEQGTKHLDFNYITILNKHFDDYFLGSKKNVLVIDYDKYQFNTSSSSLLASIQSFYHELSVPKKSTKPPTQDNHSEWTVVSRTKKKKNKKKFTSFS